MFTIFERALYCASQCSRAYFEFERSINCCAKHFFILWTGNRIDSCEHFYLRKCAALGCRAMDESSSLPNQVGCETPTQRNREKVNTKHIYTGYNWQYDINWVVIFHFGNRRCFCLYTVSIHVADIVSLRYVSVSSKYRICFFFSAILHNKQSGGFSCTIIIIYIEYWIGGGENRR